MLVNYTIVEATDPDELRGRVIERTQSGWTLQGGVAVMAIGDDNYVYCQAMAKFSEENNGSN